jgi:hypothetical protein
MHEEGLSADTFCIDRIEVYEQMSGVQWWVFGHTLRNTMA